MESAAAEKLIDLRVRNRPDGAAKRCAFPGLRTELRGDGIAKAEAGITSLDEVMRVTGS